MMHVYVVFRAVFDIDFGMLCFRARFPRLLEMCRARFAVHLRKLAAQELDSGQFGDFWGVSIFASPGINF
jgi:hypothetical protein